MLLRAKIAIERTPKTYGHINPALVGNERKILINDLSCKGKYYVQIQRDRNGVKRYR
jgi:isopropylmalate/homocitrate/citramalate synthase